MTAPLPPTNSKLEEVLKEQQEFVQQCTLANIDAAKTTGQWIIHDPNRKAALQAINKDLMDTITNIGDEPMPRIGHSGKCIRSPQSFQDGFMEAKKELRKAIQDYTGGGSDESTN